ncbi:MAG: hypothetical protein A2X49_06655 [Lentisphaerae bacterium GWF2_52_8]|nr:MAG: hypothetical protein A2X49_06655 [Lentisphaerae bacterium GWF2_52_8]
MKTDLLSKDTGIKADGIHAMLPRKQMIPSAQKLRDAYAIVPGAPIYRKEFGFYCLEKWQREEGLPKDFNAAELFSYDPPGEYRFYDLGGCEAALSPIFEVKIIEDRGETEVEQDFAGRHVLYFKGRRSGFMPEYLAHPVRDMKSWEEKVKWRMNPKSQERLEKVRSNLPKAEAAARQGMMITEFMVGGYMYLRSLIGPEELLYAFYDQPELIHDCMNTWLQLSDAISAEHQQKVSFDCVFLSEDICYNQGSLISPDMMREFLFPYYQQLIANIKRRQIDKDRHIYIQVDTDGWATPVIPLYREAIGMDGMWPFEVASGCDVVEIGRQYPGLFMSGGIDKRILAVGKDAIDRELERIIPAMRARGGYIPTCDHGVPEEVSLKNYLHYRKRCIELGG